MKYIPVVIFAMLIWSNAISAQQNRDPWSNGELMEPSVLASRISQGKANNMLILAVGPDAPIKGSVDIGEAHEQSNLKKLKNYLKNVPKDKEVVIYCGCCPFDRCPNVRPAFRALKEMGFKNPKLLNLPKNIKANWLDKNYPSN